MEASPEAAEDHPGAQLWVDHPLPMEGSADTFACEVTRAVAALTMKTTVE